MTIIVLIAAILNLVPGVVGDDDLYLTYLKSSYYFQTHSPSMALKALQKAAELDSVSSQIQLMLGKSHIMNGDYDSAMAAFQFATRLDPDNPEPYKTTGRLMLAQYSRDPDDKKLGEETEAMLKKAIRLDPLDQETFYSLALYYENIGSKEKQYGALKQAVNLHDGNPNILVKMGEIARKLGLTREANEHFGQAGEIYERYGDRLTENIELQMQLGSLSLWDTKRYHVAVRAYQRAITAMNGDESRLAYQIESEVGQATALFFMEDYEKAFTLFEKNKNHVVTNFREKLPYMLITFARQGQDAQALETLNMFDREAQSNVRLQKYLESMEAAILLASGNSQAAIEYFNSMIEKNPDNIELYLQLGQVYLNDENYEMAQQIVTRAEGKFGREESDLTFFKAVIAERLGQIATSISMLKDLVEDEKDNHLALNFIGYSMADKELDLAQAKLYIEKALELEPNQGSYLDSLGWTYYKMGDLDRAEKYLLEAVKTKYKSGEVREHMGYLYLARGQKRLALAEFETAIENELAKVKATDEIEAHILKLRQDLEETK